MRDTESFLSEVAESRRRQQIAARTGFVAPSGLRLPPALEIALAHRFLLSPVLARSAHALASARVGVPSFEREQIEFWFARYGPEANWLLETGEASGVVALEIELRLAMHSLAYLGADGHFWKHSLHFANRGSWFVLFAYAVGLPSLYGYSGLRLHFGNAILIPPSRTPSGVELVYAAPRAPLLPAPDWFREAMPRHEPVPPPQ